MNLARIVKQCRVDKPAHFRLSAHNPAETFGLSTDMAEVKPVLEKSIEKLEELQQLLYADGRWAVLIVLQGIDAAGKDGVVKHVMSGVNPQGCKVHSFKAPSAEELAHDFLWRSVKALPVRGQVGIFNRSYYEEVLVVRVHPQMLAQQHLPPDETGKGLWKHRYKDIRAFEHHLARNGTLVLKFHLRISKDEQRKRFLARLAEPHKRWKFSRNDLAERARWDDYTKAFEDMIRETSTDDVPWYVIPADHKHIAWLTVSAAIIEAMQGLQLAYPKVTGKALKELKKIERALKADQ